MPYADPEKQREKMKAIQKRYLQRKKLAEQKRHEMLLQYLKDAFAERRELRIRLSEAVAFIKVLEAKLLENAESQEVCQI